MGIVGDVVIVPSYVLVLQVIWHAEVECVIKRSVFS